MTSVVSFYRHSTDAALDAICDENLIAIWADCEVPRVADYVSLNGKIHVVKAVMWERAECDQIVANCIV